MMLMTMMMVVIVLMVKVAAMAMVVMMVMLRIPNKSLTPAAELKFARLCGRVESQKYSSEMIVDPSTDDAPSPPASRTTSGSRPPWAYTFMGTG